MEEVYHKEWEFDPNDAFAALYWLESDIIDNMLEIEEGDKLIVVIYRKPKDDLR